MKVLHKGTQTLTTPRLLLRRFREEDAQQVFEAWAGDPAVTRYLNWMPHEEVGVTRQVLAYWIEEYDSNQVYNWAIEFEGRVIGSLCAVEMSEKNGFVQVAYCLGQAYWNLGLMTEALHRVLLFFLRECCFHRVYARHVMENGASGRVMEKAGMRLEGVLRQQKRMEDGTWRDLAVYGILRGEETT